MSKNPVYYKVVTGNLTSVVMPKIDAHYSVQYSETEFVSGPDNTPVFLFNNLGDAKRFWETDCDTNGRIYEVEATGVHRRKFMGDCCNPRKFWRDYFVARLLHKTVKSVFRCALFSHSTVFAKSVRLAKRIR